MKVDEAIRLNSYLSKCGISSRRTAEKLILEGRVKVNNVVIRELGTKIVEGDIVLFDDKPIQKKELKQYVALNKPVGYLCSMSDPFGRPLALELLKKDYHERLHNVGRLDLESSGLIFFTNDGDFTYLLSHPRSEIEKEYEVECLQEIPTALLEDFPKGIRIKGIEYTSLSCRRISPNKAAIILIEGKNREIRNVFMNAGLNILSLTRVRIGQVRLGNLKDGAYRPLSNTELESFWKIHLESKGGLQS